MNAELLHVAPRARLLLIKSAHHHAGMYAHSGKYVLINGRWRNLHPDKPVPKGAPIAAHPKAAGEHAPAKHFSDEEWGKLKLPESNVNAGSHNKALDKLKQWSESGDVTAILGAGYGSNTYGKKLAAVANHLLGLHGSQHKVAAGQKAGSHAAVAAQQAAQQEAPKEQPAVAAQKPGGGPQKGVIDGPLKGTEMGAVVEGHGKAYLEHLVAKHPHTDVANHAAAVLAAKYGVAPPPAAEPAPARSASPKSSSMVDQLEDEAGLKKFIAMYEGDAQTPKEQALLDQAKAKLAKLQEGQAKPDDAGSEYGMYASLKGDVDEAVEKGDKGALQDIEKYLTTPQNKDEPGAAELLAHVEKGLERLGKKPEPVTHAALDETELPPAPTSLFGSFLIQAGKIADAAQAGDFAAVEAAVKQAESDYSPHSAASLAMLDYAQAVKQAMQDKAGYSPELVPEKPAAAPAPASSGLSMPAFVEGKNKVGVKAYYEKQAQKVIDHALAGNAAVLEDMKAAGLKPNYKTGKVSNTWAGKTANSKAFLRLFDKALQHAKGGAKPAAATPEPGTAEALEKLMADVDAAAAAGDSGKAVSLANAHVQSNGKADWAVSEAVDVLQAAGLSDAAKVFKQGFNKEPRLVLPKKPRDAAPAAKPAGDAKPQPAGTGKLDQIPWDTLLLPSSNVNAKSHNAKVAKIKAMAYAGDVAGLEAFKAGVNTYGKKQALLAKTALAALKEGGAPAPAPAAAPQEDAAEATAKQFQEMKELAGKAGFGVLQDPYKGYLLANQYGNLKIFFDITNAEAAAAQMTKVGVNASVTGVDGVYKVALHGKLPEMVMPSGAAAAEDGPKEGDTKPGADGMLVLKDGHWVKMNKDEGGGVDSVTPEQKAGIMAWLNSGDDSDESSVHDQAKALYHSLSLELKKQLVKEQIKVATGKAEPPAAASPIDAIEMPPTSGFKNPSKAQDALNALKELVKTEGASALKGLTKKMSNGVLITKLPIPGTASVLKIKGHIDHPDSSHTKVYEYVEAMKAAAGKSKKGAKKVVASAPSALAAPSPAAAVTGGGMESADQWVQTGEQAGSNPGGRFKDQTGQEWYVKWPADSDMARSELLAAKLYALAGLAGQDAKLVTKNGKTSIASKWMNISKAGGPAALSAVADVQSGFAVDAWLGNWDVVGLKYDNLQVGPDGKAYRVDAGGSLEYRAQGEKKPFGNTVDEIDTLRDASKNAQAAAVFGKMTDADITASVARVLKISDIAIRAMVNQFGPGDAAARAKLAETLIARKADLAKRFPAAAKSQKKHTFDPTKISAPPSFTNWGGSGKSGPSSKEFVNQANETAVQAIFAAAKTGDIEAVQNLDLPIFNKDTGVQTGHAKALDHPSQHVKGYAQQAINEIHYQLNPPKRFRFDGGHPLAALHHAYPAHPGGKASATVQKVGKFLMLGEPGLVKAEDLQLPEKIKHSSAGGSLTTSTYAKQAKEAFAKMPATQLQAIKSYTGSGYHEINHSLWSGNESGAAKSAGEAIKTLGHDIAPGTLLSRKLSVHGADLDALLKSAGKVLQEPAVMSTSIRPSSWSGNVQLKLHVGPGVKGLWVGPGSKPNGGAVSQHESEDEMILPPGTRLLILGVKNGADADGFGHNSTHVVEAVILPTN